MSKVFIAGTEVVVRDGESLSSAIKRTVRENRIKKEEETGPAVSTHRIPDNDKTIVNSYSSGDSQKNVKSLQDRLKKQRKK